MITAQSSPSLSPFRPDVLRGLSAAKKHLPCKYFYDEAGSALFEQITELPEYYPTRTERAIMEKHAPMMADGLGTRCLLIEYGSGSSAKTRLLLDHLPDPAGYIPIDVSGEHLDRSARLLAQDFPHVEVLPPVRGLHRPVEAACDAEAREKARGVFPWLDDWQLHAGGGDGAAAPDGDAVRVWRCSDSGR